MKWNVTAEAVRGTSHEKTGQPCQDAVQWRRLPGGELAAAVADGAGSAALAEIGAGLAARAAVEALCTAGDARTGAGKNPELTLREALAAARAAVSTEADARGVEARELASTLIVLLAGAESVAVAQVGDGAAVVGEANGNIVALTVPQSGEYLNETTFLTAPDALDQADVTVWQGQATHLALFSDGLQRLALKMPEGAPHSPFFAPLFRFIEQTTDPDTGDAELAAFLRSPRIAARTDDDLTLLLAHLTR